MIQTLLLAAESTGPQHAEGVWQGNNWMPGVTALVVFLIAFSVLYVKVWPMIVKGLDDRENKIRDEIKSAEEAREQAKSALEEYEQSLASAREEANQMIAKARQDAKAVADELRSRNDEELAELKQRATRDIEGAKQAAIAELHEHAASLASIMAGKILQREVSVSDQQRLVDESLQELAGSRGAPN